MLGASCASCAHAAQPTSILLETRGVDAAGHAYATYTVKCSDGTRKTITAFDERRTWCQGEAMRENCENKQIKAAKKACR